MSAPETTAGPALDGVSEGRLVALALDPGVTTGYCYGALCERTLKLTVGEWEESLGHMYTVLTKLCKDARGDVHLIYEDFTYRNASRMGADLTPVKVIGVIELFREWYEPFVAFHKQSASTGKAFYNDDKLKALDAYKVGKKHGRDATRHLLQWANFGAGSAFINMQDVMVEQIELEEMLYILQS